MEPSPHEQALEVIRSRKNILIALPANPSPDAIASGQALAAVLATIGKAVTLASSGYQAPTVLNFLPKQYAVQSEFDANRKLVVSVRLNQAKLDSLSYGIEGDELKIYITPKQGTVLPDDVASSSADFNFDCIITLDVQSFVNLSTLFESNAEFFYQTPVLNIDHHATNDNFGQVNLVDLVATSTAEIVLELLQDLKPDLVDDAVATNLLTGIITKTRCFRTTSVTPKSLAAASKLIEVGAKREDIIRHLYQTHSLATLKLWGRALARLKEEYRGQFVWTMLSRTDFEKSETTETSLEGVVDELIANTPRARIVVILYESSDGSIRGLISSRQPVRNHEVFNGLSISGTDEYATVVFPGREMHESETNLRDRVAAYLNKRGLLE